MLKCSQGLGRFLGNVNEGDPPPRRGAPQSTFRYWGKFWGRTRDTRRFVSWRGGVSRPCLSPRRWSEADGNGAPLSRPASLSSLLPRSPEAPRAPRESPRPHRHWTEATGPSPRRRVLLACSLKAKLSTPFQNVARGARGKMRSQCSLFFGGDLFNFHCMPHAWGDKNLPEHSSRSLTPPRFLSLRSSHEMMEIGAL